MCMTVWVPGFRKTDPLLTLQAVKYFNTYSPVQLKYCLSNQINQSWMYVFTKCFSLSCRSWHASNNRTQTISFDRVHHEMGAREERCPLLQEVRHQPGTRAETTQVITSDEVMCAPLWTSSPVTMASKCCHCYNTWMECDCTVDYCDINFLSSGKITHRQVFCQIY